MSDTNLIIATAAGTRSSAVSEAGSTWIRKGTPDEGQWTDIAYGENRFVAIHNGSLSAMSLDGAVWEMSNLPYLEYIDYDDGTPDIPLTSLPNKYQPRWCSIAYGNELFVAIADRTKTYATSELSLIHI